MPVLSRVRASCAYACLTAVVMAGEGEGGVKGPKVLPFTCEMVAIFFSRLVNE